MKLVEIITLGRITREEQLSPQDRQRARQAPGLMKLIEENHALGQVIEDCPPTPSWNSLRAGIYARAEHVRLSPWERMLQVVSVSPRWAMAGMGAAALLVIMALSLVLTLSPSTGDSEVNYTRSNSRPQTTYASYQAFKYQ